MVISQSIPSDRRIGFFWYSFKTSGKNFYYVNAAAKSKQLLFDSRFMAAELRKLTHHPYNDLDLPSGA
jgi:hypothetical protein